MYKGRIMPDTLKNILKEEYMMKKLLILILSLSMSVAALSSCSLLGGSETSSSDAPASSVETPASSEEDSSTSEVEEKFYNVKFTVNGEVIKTVEVKEGGAVAAADIPVLEEKTGYTMAWENVDLSNITADIEVKAVATANTYTITFDENGGESVEDMSVVYDSEVTLPTPVRTGFDFVAWMDADENAVRSGKWTIASNITLTASWNEIIPDTYTVNFVQDGQPIKSYTVNEGTDFTNIPDTAEKTGYTVVWNTDDLAQLSNIQSNVTVHAVETANTYTVTFSDAKNIFTGTVDVTYDAPYNWSNLLTMVTGYNFEKLTSEEGAFVAMSGTWTIADDQTITANWTAKEYTVVLTVGNGGTCTQTTMTVTYDGHYTIPAVTVTDGYVFEGWKLNGTLIASAGTWSYDSNETIELVASLKTEEWTKNY